MNFKKPELLCPAKDPEVLRTAVNFGADAVYIGGEAYSLRAKARNFSRRDMAEGIRWAHERGAKVYVTANIFAHEADMDGAARYFDELKELQPDAVLVADAGMFDLAREHCPDVDIHISTQANSTNAGTFRFWHRLGAKRVVCARELSLKEIRQIRDEIPEDLEIEAFVHGAMCISYSGRCLLSNYFTGRDANHGACTHPCRWKYAVAEESRPGMYLPIEENERGTFVFNSRDLCMVEHIPDLVRAGIDSFKIEGRMKNALYVAGAARTYRQAIDDFFTSEALYEENLEHYREEIHRCTYRRFSTGFYYGRPDADAMVYDSNTYVNETVWLGICGAPQDGLIPFMQRNKFSVGDTIEIMKPDGRDVPAKVLRLVNEDGGEQESAPHPQQMLRAELSESAEEGDILRSVPLT